MSAAYEKAFVQNGKTWGHVIDPRSGLPVQGALLAAVAHPSPTECDALSTALLVLGCDAGELKRSPNDTIRSLTVCQGEEGGVRVTQAGINPLPTFTNEAGNLQ